MTVRPAKTQISLGIHPVWSESSLSVWRKLGSLSTHWAHSEDSDQTGRMPRLIWVFAGRTCHFVCLIMKRLIFQLLKDHMVLYKDRDIESFIDGETLFTTDSKVLTVHRRQEGKKLRKTSTNEPAQEIIPRSLTRTVAVRTHEVWKQTKRPTKNQTSISTGWLRMRVEEWVYGGRKVP